MSKRPDRVLLEDMRDSCERVARYLEGFDRDRFLSDEKTADAVVRNHEIISEAANRLTETFRNQNAHIKWRKIIGLRHRIVYNYFGFDLELVWAICKRDLPLLRTG